MNAPAWTLDQIHWHRFQAGRVDGQTLAAVKTAALVEFNADDYVAYLDQVFADDPDTRAQIARWGAEERQHGQALARWAELADPTFDFGAAMERFRAGYRIHPGAVASVRGTRAGEMIARCIVECGTSSFYSSLRDGTDEPVLRQIATLVARDEFQHYRLFHAAYLRLAPIDRIGLVERMRIALGRVREADDDELAFAWWSANLAGRDVPYDRTACFRAQQQAALRSYRHDHVRRAVHMIARAVGLRPTGLATRAITALAWRHTRRRSAPPVHP